ncbi:MAG: 2-oxo acid dehydrogenase subunit E2 [Peptoniphilus sp.]|nr:2-oxo acid dehydrogenase subunit E2 [Peptoniphilus sp.]MDD7362628.1 2-oxo acid dehydrogenase subunit E2 [Bacillota bacterium]MDY6044973.1 2-oxo acid dehydrogenase subunit E2 [Peptoniphilus sp.]
MAKKIVMPKLGLTMKEGKIVKWHVKEGDYVKKGQDLFDVENEKLTNTIESPADGKLLKILLEEGGRAPVLEPVGILGEEGEDIGELLERTESAEKVSQKEDKQPKVEPVEREKTSKRIIAAPVAKKLAREKGVDLSRIRGSGPKGRIVLKDVEAFLDRLDKEVAPDPSAKEATEGTDSKPTRILATPLAKKMAEEEGVDLARIAKDGRIRAEDVAEFIKSGAEGGRPSTEDRTMREEMSGMRQVIARRMKESWDRTAPVSYHISVDVTQWVQYRDFLKREGIHVSYTDLLIKLVSKALMVYRVVNASLEGDEVVYHDYVNMGLAVDVDQGLLVPVIGNSHEKSLEEISEEARKAAADARSGNISPDALQGGTFTISNLGMFGIEEFSPIINLPEAAILGVGAIEDMPVVIEGAVVARPIMKLSLTADHRLIDGATAARFLRWIKERIEMPSMLL